MELERQLVVYHVWQKGSHLVEKVEQMIAKEKQQMEDEENRLNGI